MRLLVVRNPASGASIPSRFWVAGTLKPIFQPMGSAPCASSSRRRVSSAFVPRSTLTASSRS
jgi:hypothetical protein